MSHQSSQGSVCRFCSAPLRHVFVDLGMSPLCESYLGSDQLNEMERFYPLKVYICGDCFLVQLEEFVSPNEIFTEYAYFSSYSDSWVKHAKDYTDMIIQRLGLDEDSSVIEVGSNDGYLLEHFIERGVPVLGIEPAANVAAAAIQKGVSTVVSFFGMQVAQRLAAKGEKADLLIANNVLAQVPGINDFVGGLAIALKPSGVLTMEFPHLVRLMEFNQFDTIYHEHFSYFSFMAVQKILSTHRLTIFDVEELPTHGGSLRIFARRSDDSSNSVSERVRELKAMEESEGFGRLKCYSRFAEQVKETKRNLLDFLISAKRQRKSIAGYGAPGKGNTLLNYCGIKSDFLDYTVDRNPYKQGKYLPGSHIAICAPDKIRETRPDYVLILPWNLKEEIMSQMSYIREWAGRFVVPIPEVQLYP